MRKLIVLCLMLFSQFSFAAKEVALTFDDAPVGDSTFFKSDARRDMLIQALKRNGVPETIVFANPCRRSATEIYGVLKPYIQAGHIIGNHTCTHPDLDKVGAADFIADSEKADKILAPLMRPEARFFRFPFLHAGASATLRDELKEWMKKAGYREGIVSIDTNDWVVSEKIQQAVQAGKKVDQRRISKILAKHLSGALEFYDGLALKTLGRSPKHVMLLHEIDATVFSMDEIVSELRRKGWRVISALEAYNDPIYQISYSNTYANDGIIAQAAFEKTGEKHFLKDFLYEELRTELQLP